MSGDSLLPITAIEFQRKIDPATDWGRAPALKWLPLQALRVDQSYQRDVLEAGRATIRRIVEQFRWSRFGQIVVSARAGGVYAIVDGQHRAVACALLGIAEVPCVVITCEIEEEAEAFAAINGNVTRPSTLQIFAARLVARDRKARALHACYTNSGVSVPRIAYICDKPGMCTAIGCLESCFKKFGADVLGQALTLIVDLGENGIGMLKPTIIGGLCDVLAGKPRPRLGDLRAVLEGKQLEKLYDKARQRQSLDGGPVRGHFVEQLRKALEREKVAA